MSVELRPWVKKYQGKCFVSFGEDDCPVYIHVKKVVKIDDSATDNPELYNITTISDIVYDALAVISQTNRKWYLDDYRVKDLKYTKITRNEFDNMMKKSVKNYECKDYFADMSLEDYSKYFGLPR